MLIVHSFFPSECSPNPQSCKAKLYPEEVKGIVSDEFYEVYRTNFNRANAAAVGGGVVGLFHHADDGQCAVPVKAGSKRLATYRKRRASKHRKTYRRWLKWI